jgi:hypothetical protein
VRADHYTILEISHNATLGEIKSAYRKLARKLHPDSNPDYKKDPAVRKHWREVSDAYEVLSAPDRRAAYDELLGSTLPQAEQTAPAPNQSQPPRASKMPPSVRTPSAGPQKLADRPPRSPLPTIWNDIPPVDSPIPSTRRHRSPFLNDLIWGVISLGSGVFTLVSGIVFHSEFVQHPGQGFPGGVAIFIGIVTGILSIPAIGGLGGILLILLGVLFLCRALTDALR